MEPAVQQRTRFDLDLFLALNEEYRDKPVVATPRKFTGDALTAQAESRASSIAKRVDVAGKRILEVGAGRGQLGQVLTRTPGATYVGVDVVEYDTWDEIQSADVRLVRRDISAEDSADLGQFDVIVSLAVLEHVVHPHAMLSAMYQRLRPGGVAYLTANLYRGPQASHRYRQVFFPWPHLLFADDVWREFYRTQHNRDETFSWVNKLTYAHYLQYFDLVGFHQRKTWLTPSKFDAGFYQRFEDQLSRYPVFDLSHDFVYAVLERPRSPLRRPKSGVQVGGDHPRLRQALAGLPDPWQTRVTTALKRVAAFRPR